LVTCSRALSPWQNTESPVAKIADGGVASIEKILVATPHPDKEYLIVSVPALSADIVPELVTDAIAGPLLVHVPPCADAVSVNVDPVQSTDVSAAILVAVDEESVNLARKPSPLVLVPPA
jgi:hypothetical protein